MRIRKGHHGLIRFSSYFPVAYSFDPSFALRMNDPLSLISLPSLDLLRGFVAVGRRMSITLAAQDLGLTQSAVSRQVQALEEAVGTPLLVRGHRSISFTSVGERLFRSADSAVQQLQDVLGTIQPPSDCLPVTVSASLGVTGLWLLPRLARLQEQCPGLDVRVSACNEVQDLRRYGIDLAIRCASHLPATEHARQLFGESVVPVAHPSLGLQQTWSAESLPDLTLIELDDPHSPWLRWDDWLQAAGWSVRPRAVLRFAQYEQVIHAALAGQGVALGRVALIQPLLDDQRLVSLGAPQPAGTDRAYWLVHADHRLRPEVRQVSDWIVAEASACV